MSQPCILVLGANGSLGRPIASAVAARPGLTLVAGLRQPSTTIPHGYRLADATQVPDLTAALDGITHVINAAGGPPATLHATARALCAALRDRPHIRLVHLSSMAVYGALTGLVGEDAPLSALNRYAAAKIAAEAELRLHIAAGGLAVILRPGIVTGPHSTQWTGRLTRLLRARRLGDLGPAGDGLCNHIHESDLADACIQACLAPEAAGLAFNLAAPNPPRWNEFLIALARDAGAIPVRRLTRRRLAFEARLLAPALIAAHRLTGSLRIPPAIPPSLLRLFAQPIRLDGTRAEKILHEPAPARRLAAE